MDKLADNPFLDADLGPDVPLLQGEILSLAEVRELHQEVIDSFTINQQETDDMSTEQEIEQDLQRKNLNAPRLCPADIDAVIVGENFTVLPSGKAMICELMLRNGFTVRGESACVSKENFDEEIGRKISREDARSKVWGFEGYRLQERHSLYRSDYRQIVEQIAEASHEVNREYCRGIGDYSQASWKDSPDWQKESAILGVQLHLDQPGAGPQASHDSWSAQKIADGWSYGQVKDADIKQHPCLVPFSALPLEQQAKDFIFRAVIHSLAKILLV